MEEEDEILVEEEEEKKEEEEGEKKEEEEEEKKEEEERDKCGDEPQSSGGCRGDDRPLLISWSTSGSLTTLQNSSCPRNETTSAGSRSLKWVWICDHDRMPVRDASKLCSLKSRGAKMRPLILVSKLSISRMIQLFSRLCEFLRNKILIRSLRDSVSSHSRSVLRGIG